jgi:hypothetical protein
MHKYSLKVYQAREVGLVMREMDLGTTGRRKCQRPGIRAPRIGKVDTSSKEGKSCFANTGKEWWRYILVQARGGEEPIFQAPYRWPNAFDLRVPATKRVFGCTFSLKYFFRL